MELLEEIEKEEWIDSLLSKEERESYTQATICFSVQDLVLIKAQAKELGIGYQNNYTTGKIKLGIEGICT